MRTRRDSLANVSCRAAACAPARDGEGVRSARGGRDADRHGPRIRPRHAARRSPRPHGRIHRHAHRMESRVRACARKGVCGRSDSACKPCAHKRREHAPAFVQLATLPACRFNIKKPKPVCGALPALPRERSTRGPQVLTKKQARAARALAQTARPPGACPQKKHVTVHFSGAMRGLRGVRLLDALAFQLHQKGCRPQPRHRTRAGHGRGCVRLLVLAHHFLESVHLVGLLMRAGRG